VKDRPYKNSKNGVQISSVYNSRKKIDWRHVRRPPTFADHPQIALQHLRINFFQAVEHGGQREALLTHYSLLITHHALLIAHRS
jgi:hypothetical protein